MREWIDKHIAGGASIQWRGWGLGVDSWFGESVFELAITLGPINAWVGYWY